MSLPTVVFLAPAAVCVLAWLGAGAMLPRRLLADGDLLVALTQLAAGSVALSLVLYGLGRLGAFEPVVPIVLTVLLAVPGVWAAVGLARRAALPTFRGKLAVMLLAAVGVSLAAHLLLATAPPIANDALSYHLALPERWLELGRIDDAFWRWESFNPFGVQMLYAQALALAGDSAAGAVCASLAAFAALAVFGLARELGGNDVTAGAAAAFLFVFQGLFTWQATASFAEGGLTFYTVLAAWHGVRYVRTSAVEPAAWAGFSIGAAAGAKYHGLLLAACVVVPLGVVALARRQWRPVATAALLAGAVPSAWYVKNLVVAGNPVYPMFTGVFGGKWSAGYASSPTGVGDQQFGVDDSPARLLALPFDLVRYSSSFDRGRSVGVAILVLAAVALLPGLPARRISLAILAAGAVYLVLWQSLSPQARYLLPLLGVLAAPAGLVLAQAWQRARWTQLAALAVLAGVAAAWLLLPTGVHFLRKLAPVAAGLQPRDVFVDNMTGTAYALERAAAKANAPIAVAGYKYTYYYPGLAIHLEKPEFRAELSRAVYVDRLRAHGIRYVLVREGAKLPQIRPIRRCLRPVARFPARPVLFANADPRGRMTLGLYSTARCERIAAVGREP